MKLTKVKISKQQVVVILDWIDGIFSEGNDPGRSDAGGAEGDDRILIQRITAARGIGPSIIPSADDSVYLVTVELTVFCLPQIICMGMEREAEAIAMAQTVDLLRIDVRIREEEGIIAWCGAIGRIHPQDLASEGRRILRVC